jgi:hypothetical protein
VIDDSPPTAPSCATDDIMSDVSSDHYCVPPTHNSTPPTHRQRARARAVASAREGALAAVTSCVQSALNNFNRFVVTI